MSSAELKQSIIEISKNLSSLEINTILKNNMTGGGMSHPRHALINISRTYYDQFSKIRDQYRRRHYVVSDDKPEFGKDFISAELRQYTGSYFYFDRLREEVKALAEYICNYRLAHALSAEQEADLIMLERIKDMSDQIKGVFESVYDRRSEWMKHKDIRDFWDRNVITENERLRSIWDNNYAHSDIVRMRPPFPISTSEYLLIRKAWEIGDEVIVMQTVVHLTGDVFTRIVPQYVGKDKEIIQTIHNDNVKISLDMWSEIVGTVKDFFAKLIQYK
jgi:hypothetical protein